MLFVISSHLCHVAMGDACVIKAAVSSKEVGICARIYSDQKTQI